MKTINGIDYVEHGDVVRMRVHRGGGYFDPDESIHTGGDWVEKEGVVLVKQAPFKSPYGDSFSTAGNPQGDVLTRSGRPNLAWVRFFDGDVQTTNTRRDYEYFPDGVKTYLRPATPEELEWALRPVPNPFPHS